MIDFFCFAELLFVGIIFIESPAHRWQMFFKYLCKSPCSWPGKVAIRKGQIGRYFSR